MTAEPLYALPLTIAAVGAFIDVRERRLPNAVCLALALASAFVLAAGGGLMALGSGLLHAATALLAGMVFFRMGLIGGGDAKFYAAAACGLPFERGLALLGWTSLAGFALLAALTLARLAKGERIGGMRGYSVPYGVAIFLGFGVSLAFWRPGA